MGDKFDIKFSALPPDLRLKLWVLALDANTSKVAIAYRPGSFVTSLSYDYGGNLEAALSVDRNFSAKVGVDPSSGDLDLGVVFRGFNFGANASFKGQSGGVGLGYGASLLPFPSELSGIFNSAAFGLKSVMSDVDAAPNNPLAWYKLHSDDTKAISSAMSAGQRIAKAGESPYRFGAALRLDFTPETGLTIYSGVLFRF
jgi:hypothetical protein